MNNPNSPTTSAGHSSAKAPLMVVGCTILGAAAQMLVKRGTTAMPPLYDPAWGSVLEQAPSIAWKILTNLHLIAGLGCYGVSTVLLVVALRFGELSLLYPIIALTYVWVAMLSVFALGESFNAFKLIGLTLIVLGVAVLGRKESA